MTHYHKIRILIFILLQTPVIYIAAQNNIFKNEVYFGVNAGMTGSMVLFKPDVPQSYILGRQAGIVFRYINEKNVGLHAELNYSERGWSELNRAFEKKLNYIEFPFLTHIYFGEKVRFFCNLGPKLGYLIGEQTIINIDPSSTKEQHIQNIQNKFDYGIALGLGCLFKIKRQMLQLEARGYYSANDIFANEKKDYFDNSNLIHASVTLGWLMNFNKK
ncbi:porin family protein [Paludibacter sp.]